MVASSQLLVILTAALAAAAPTKESSSHKKGFSVPVNRNPNYRQHGYSEVLRTKQKWGHNVSEEFKEFVKAHKQAVHTLRGLRNGAASSRRPASGTRIGTASVASVAVTAGGDGEGDGDGGDVEANPQESDSEYTSPVTIGTGKNKKTFTLNFDTGSSDLWVLGQKYAKAGPGHNTYANTGKLLTGHTWNIEYADRSSASGVVYTDTVQVDDDPDLIVEDMAVEVATKASEAFTSGPNDGLLGLGFSSINTVQPKRQRTWFERLAPTLPEPLFAADLKAGRPGTYDFGFVQPQYKKQLKYTPIDPSGGWYQFDCDKGYAVGDSAQKRDNGCTAIADTGTTLIYGSDKMAADYYKNIPGKGKDRWGDYTIPCNAKMPDLTLAIGAHNFVVPGSLMVFENGDGTCVGGLQGGSGGPDGEPYIYGGIALKAMYAVFDYGNKQFGFAPKDI